MKTIEEIVIKANDWLVETPIEAWGGAENGFIKGYTQCQEDMADKKYTLKQVERYHDIRATQGIKNANKYINSLNKQD